MIRWCGNCATVRLRSRVRSSGWCRSATTAALTSSPPTPPPSAPSSCAPATPAAPLSLPTLLQEPLHTAGGAPGQRRRQRKRAKGIAATAPTTAGDSSKSVSAPSTSSAAAAFRPRPRTILDFPNAYQSFSAVMPLPEFRRSYEHIKPNTTLREAQDVRVGGRVVSIRDMGGVVFLTIRSGEATLQLIRRADANFTKVELRAFCDSLHVGDILGASGFPGRTAKGELSLYITSASILAPYVCTDQALCPDLKGFVPLADTDIRYRYRFVDMMVDPSVLHRARKRHAITRALRNYLDVRGFTEVETPMLHSVASGANARPFATHHNANNADLFLRVAPELHLKQCVVGGMDRVYEIGRVFRNEDADRSHNPEFTTCEFYAAYHTYEDLMVMTEEIMRCLALAANGTTQISVISHVTKETVEIDLAKPFRRVNAFDEVQHAAGVELPPPQELNTARGMAYMSAILLRYSIPLPSVRTAAKMFDKLIDYFITDRVVEPTFVTDHPLCMSPLAMEQRTRPGLSARFELFVNGTEYCNAYNELTDPQEQYYRFQQQVLDRRTGDEEAMSLDETFLKALQVGLPPTAGWGMGIDRVVMLLNGSSSIRDDILFPLLRDDAGSHDAKRRRKTASFFGFHHNMTLFCLSALEEEMRQRGESADALEKLQQLRKYLSTMQQRSSLKCEPEEDSVRGWRYAAALALLRLFFYRGK